MINSGREWDWMDECRIHNSIEESMLEEEEGVYKSTTREFDKGSRI